MRVTRVRRAAIVAAVLAATAAGCTVGDGHPPDGHSAHPTVEEARGPVLAVKIDNVGPARPQTGIGRADIIYAEQVESGLSRLMAVYATRLPPVVGPVRSARETDLELLRQFDRPALAFSGAQSKLLPLIAEAPLTALPPGKAPAAAYFRGSDRPAPHNLYLRPAKLGGRRRRARWLRPGSRSGRPRRAGRRRTPSRCASPRPASLSTGRHRAAVGRCRWTAPGRAPRTAGR